MNQTIIALDTNIWIYMAKSASASLIEDLNKEIDSGNLKLIANDLILKEWNRNKAKTIKAVSESIKSEANCAKKISEYITCQEDKQKYLDIILSYKDEINRIQAATDKIDMVENLLKKCICTNITEQQINHISHLAIDSLPPMQDKKNNFNDALIVRNLVEYICSIVKEQGSATPNKYDFIFVSNNPDDFIDKKTGAIYPEIVDGIELADTITIANVKELGQALNIRTDLIDDFDDWLEWMIEMQAEYEYEVMRGK